MDEIRNSNNKNDKLVKIKSKYIVMKIFENLKEIRLLNIVHYNKKYQQLMKKKLKDYINEYLKIVIEIIPKENIFDKFINLSNKSKRENIHIYFNDSIKEINREKINKDDKVTKIKIIINHKVKSLSKLFYKCKSIKRITFIKFNRNDIQNMSNMFFECLSLEKINLSNFNTNNVINMNSMFGYCSSLKELNLSNFNTNKVKNMSYMFYKCSSLEKLNLSNFNTNNVKYMSFMFYECKSLTKLNLSNFNTNRVKNMMCMFENCYSLKELNLSNFNIRTSAYAFAMFNGCSSLLSLICSNNIIKNEYELYKALHKA